MDKKIFYFHKILAEAVSNKKYNKAIKVFEKNINFVLKNDDLMYKLGLLYDHLAGKLKISKKPNYKKYLEKAEKIYKELLKKNKNNFFALYGLARINSLKNKHKKAIKYAIMAYKKKSELPYKLKGALPVAPFFEVIGDNKKAEYWYKKEFKDSPNDFGACLNLFYFYYFNKNYKKAKKLINKVEELMKNEFKKSQYKGLNIKNSKFFKKIEKTIKEIKNMPRM